MLRTKAVFSAHGADCGFAVQTSERHFGPDQHYNMRMLPETVVYKPSKLTDIDTAALVIPGQQQNRN